MMRQHFISQVLLKKFSPEGKQGLINIIKKPGIELLNQSISKQSASELNYNTLKLWGREYNDIELGASKIEAEIGRSYKRLEQNNFKQSNSEILLFLNFGSFLYVNNPVIRENIANSQKSLYKVISEMLSGDTKLLKNTLNKTNIPYKESIDVEELAKSFRSGNIKIDVPKEEIVIPLINTKDTVFDELTKMFWSFFIIKDESYYITSDVPLVPFSRNWKFNFAPGLGIADSIMFPITKKVCLVGQRIGKVNNLEVTGEYANGVNYAMTIYSSQLFMPMTLKELNEQFKKYK